LIGVKSTEKNNAYQLLRGWKHFGSLCKSMMRTIFLLSTKLKRPDFRSYCTDNGSVILKLKSEYIIYYLVLKSAFWFFRVHKMETRNAKKSYAKVVLAERGNNRF